MILIFIAVSFNKLEKKIILHKTIHKFNKVARIYFSNINNVVIMMFNLHNSVLFEEHIKKLVEIKNYLHRMYLASLYLLFSF